MTDALDGTNSSDYADCSWFTKLEDLRNEVATGAFRTASYLTDPICKSHEFYRRLYVVEELNPTSSKVVNLVRKFFLFAGLLGYAFLATFATLPGIALRFLASHSQKVPFLYSQGESPIKTLSNDRTFSLLSWNICCAIGGYAISDGGVVPWPFRIDDIIDKIVEKDADVNCIYETHDTESAFYICEKLQQKGYAHFYFNIGPMAVGVSSGILVASKYEIKNPEFTLFPQDSLVGRTKYAAKGVFAFDLTSGGNPFATVLTSHLQHSEEPEFPTAEEIEARRKQMNIIVEKAEGVKDRCVVVTGDLNLDDNEYRASTWHTRFQKGDQFAGKTWGGDAFCAHMVGKQISVPLNLDHTMILSGTTRSISTTLVETGFDGALFKKEALSDHAGLFSWIAV